MDRLSRLLRDQDPAELRQHGLAVDGHGRLVSVHELRAQVERSVGREELGWQWPFRARAARHLRNLEAPKRMARGTQLEIDATGEPDYEELLITSTPLDV